MFQVWRILIQVDVDASLGSAIIIASKMPFEGIASPCQGLHAYRCHQQQSPLPPHLPLRHIHKHAAPGQKHHVNQQQPIPLWQLR